MISLGVGFPELARDCLPEGRPRPGPHETGNVPRDFHETGNVPRGFHQI